MAYADFIKAVAAAKSAGSSNNYSKKDLVDLTMEIFNDSTCSFQVHTKKGDTFETKDVNPGKQMRDQLIAPILKTFGVDKDELPKLDTVQTSRAGAESIADMSLLVMKAYVSQEGLGRKMILPMTSATDTVQSISTVHVEQESRNTTMITRDADGNYSTTPTGKVVTTAAHDKLVAKNRVPAWLKTTKDAK